MALTNDKNRDFKDLFEALIKVKPKIRLTRL